MNQPVPGIATILEDLGLETRDITVMIIGGAGTEVPDANIIQAYDKLSEPGELPTTLKAALGIVVSPLDFMTRSSAEQLLSRLRDVHCEMVLLVDADGRWNAEELRPLGYLAAGQSSIDVSCYLFDPDAFNQPREWNNPSDWANPENFRKYRW